MKHRGFTRQTIVDSALRATVDQIYDIVNAELTLQHTGGSVTTDGTEQVVYVNNAPLGVFRPVVFHASLNNMLAGDTVAFRVYYRIFPAAGLEQIDYQSYTGGGGGLANGSTLIALQLDPNRYGMQVTIERLTGTDRAYQWEIFVEA